MASYVQRRPGRASGNIPLLWEHEVIGDKNRKITGRSLALKEKKRVQPATQKADFVEREEIGVLSVKVRQELEGEAERR